MIGEQAGRSRARLALVTGLSGVLVASEAGYWDETDTVLGTIHVSPEPSWMTIAASIESDGVIEEHFRPSLLLAFSTGCDLDVVIRDDTGEVVLDETMADHADCSGMLFSLPMTGCSPDLPGRCVATFDVEVGSPREMEVSWKVEVAVHGRVGCNESPPPTTVDASVEVEDS